MTRNALPSRYSGVAQILHWVTAALIVIQFALAWSAAVLPSGLHKLALLARHKSFGMSILVLACARLLWRETHPAPVLPSRMTAMERILAHVTHYGLYFLLFAMPLTGWMMSSAKNYSVSWFGLFTWPNLLSQNETAFNMLKVTHYGLGIALFVIALLHMVAALKHHFWNKDDVLTRMLPFFKTTKSS